MQNSTSLHLLKLNPASKASMVFNTSIFRQLLKDSSGTVIMVGLDKLLFYGWKLPYELLRTSTIVLKAFITHKFKVYSNSPGGMRRVFLQSYVF